MEIAQTLCGKEQSDALSSKNCGGLALQCPSGHHGCETSIASVEHVVMLRVQHQQKLENGCALLRFSHEHERIQSDWSAKEDQSKDGSQVGHAHLGLFFMVDDQSEKVQQASHHLVVFVRQSGQGGVHEQSHMLTGSVRGGRGLGASQSAGIDESFQARLRDQRGFALAESRLEDVSSLIGI